MNSHLIITNKGKQFGVDIKRVKEILPLRSTCEYPTSSEFVVGGVNVRGVVIPLTDLRIIFNEPTIRAEREALVEMLKQKEQEHIDWLDALFVSVREDKEFTKTLDPTKCAFGQWFYSFQPKDHGIERILSRFEEPHREIHALAEKVFGVKDKEKAIKILENARRTTLSRLLRLFAELKHALVADLRQLFLVLSSEQGDFGLIVDSVESLRSFTGLKCSEGKHPLVSTVWSSSSEVIYELSLDKIFHNDEMVFH